MRNALFSYNDGTPNALLLEIFDDHGASTSRADRARRALAAGALIDTPIFDDGTTLLMSACECGNTDRIELLIAFGADPNARRLNGDTPLWCASALHGQHQEAMIILLTRGARIEDGAPDGSDALDKLIFLRTQGFKNPFGSLDQRIAILEAAKLAAIPAPSRAPGTGLRI